MYLEYPEIQLAELTIDINKIISEKEINKKYKIAADEFKNSYWAWYKRYEQQYKILRLTAEPNSFFEAVVKTGVEETVTMAAEEIIKSNSKALLAKGAIPWLKKIFLPLTIYEIIKNFSVDAILIFRNYKANQALIMSAINYCLWKYMEQKVKFNTGTAQSDREQRRILLNSKYLFGDIEWSFKDGIGTGKFADGENIPFASVYCSIIEKISDKYALHFVGNFGGGNVIYSELLLVGLTDNTPIKYDEISYNSVDSPTTHTNIFTVYKYTYQESDAMCCPSIKWELKYIIKNNRFTKISERKL
jgi:hypothetical protein